MRHLLAVLVVAVAFAATGCVAPADKSNAIPATPVCERLYFGRAIPSGGEVSDAQWTQFVTEVVVPRFPSGFSIYAGDGYWRGEDGVTRHERSLVFEVVHDGSGTNSRALGEIARLYVERFRQEAVMRVRVAAQQEFVVQPVAPAPASPGRK